MQKKYITGPNTPVLEAGGMICVAGPAHSGKTNVLLDLLAGIVSHVENHPFTAKVAAIFQEDAWETIGEGYKARGVAKLLESGGQLRTWCAGEADALLRTAGDFDGGLARALADYDIVIIDNLYFADGNVTQTQVAFANAIWKALPNKQVIFSYNLRPQRQDERGVGGVTTTQIDMSQIDRTLPITNLSIVDCFHDVLLAGYMAGIHTDEGSRALSSGLHQKLIGFDIFCMGQTRGSGWQVPISQADINANVTQTQVSWSAPTPGFSSQMQCMAVDWAALTHAAINLLSDIHSAGMASSVGRNNYRLSRFELGRSPTGRQVKMSFISPEMGNIDLEIGLEGPVNNNTLSSRHPRRNSFGGCYHGAILSGSQDE